MKRIFVLGFVLASVALAGAGCARQQPAASTPATSPASPAQKAPTFSLQDYSGKTISSSDFVGTPLVINSWAAWCPFCREELKDFAAVQDEFKGRVVFIAIDRAEPFETAKQFSDALGVTDRLIFLLDPDDSFYRSLGGFSMPETIFVDADGFIRHHRRGPLTAEDARVLVRSLLGDGVEGTPSASGDDEAVVGARVNYTGSGFSPNPVRITRGGSVTFINESSGSVRITSDGFAGSGVLQSEGTYTVKLNNPGTVRYQNQLKASETGEIVVE